MKSPITIGRRCSLCLTVFVFFVGMAQLGAAEPSFTKKASPASRTVIATPPKVEKYSNPARSYGTNGYTNPCFIAPGSDQTPTDQSAWPNLVLDEFWFWLWF